MASVQIPGRNCNGKVGQIADYAGLGNVNDGKNGADESYPRAAEVGGKCFPGGYDGGRSDNVFCGVKEGAWAPVSLSHTFLRGHQCTIITSWTIRCRWLLPPLFTFSLNWHRQDPFPSTFYPLESSELLKMTTTIGGNANEKREPLEPTSVHPVGTRRQVE